MKDFESTNDYYSRVDKVVNNLRAYRDTISEKKASEKILVTCTEIYDPIIVTVEEYKYTNKLITIELMDI